MPNKTKPAKPTSKGINWHPLVAVFFVVALYYVSQILGVLVVSIYPRLHHWGLAQANNWLSNSIPAQFFYVLVVEALTVLALYYFLRWRQVSWRKIGWRRPRWEDAAWGWMILPAYLLTYFLLAAVLKQLIPALNVDQSQQTGFTNASGGLDMVLTFVSLVVLPPLVEEILMRGFLYTSLRQKLKPWTAAIITSVIFASAHLQAGSGAPLLWIAFIDTFTLSMYLVFLRQKTGGLWAGITLHATKNLLAFISLFYLHFR